MGVTEDEASAGVGADASATDDWDAYGAVVRLVAGGAGYGLDQLKQLEQNLEPSDSAETGEVHADWGSAAALVVGFVADLPDRLERGRSSLESVSAPLGSLGRPLWRVVSVTALGRVVEGSIEATRDIVDAEVRRLVELGRIEYANGRVLASAVLNEGIDAMLDAVSDSDSLSALVREQTMGVTGGAVREVRETGAAADGLTEEIFRRLLRRPRRAFPPRPATEQP